jgi:DNA-binding response OmpR family regulator
MRSRNLGRAVGGAVVDNQGLVSSRQAIQHPGQSGRFVQAGQDHLDCHVCEARDSTWVRPARNAFCSLTGRRGHITPELHCVESAYACRVSARVLVVEDDETVAGVLSAYLTRAGYESLWASDGTEALSMWSRTKPDVVILDILLPTISGLEVLRRRRASADDAAVIILSARGEEEDRLVGLETGADDYLVKPFSPREVVLRVEALLRRAERLTGNRLLTETLSIGDVTIDLAAHVATRGGSQLSLTSREFDLLAFLAANPGQTFSKADLLRRVWGWDFGDTSTVTVHVRRLREKLEDDPSDPRIVLTVGRAGYRIARETELR